MTCKKACLLLDALLDGELSADEMAAVRGHLSKCICCNQELQALKLLKAELKRLNRATPDSNFEDRLLAFVESESRRRPKVARKRARIAASAAVLAAVMTMASMQVSASHREQEARVEQLRMELERDQAAQRIENPLSGGTFIMPANYGR